MSRRNLVAALAFGFVGTSGAFLSTTALFAEEGASGRGSVQVTELAALEQTFQDAADRIAPSVVQVQVKRKSSGRASGGRRQNAYSTRPDDPVSGVVVGAEGWILTTAWNVADEPESIAVVLPDGRTFEAKRLGLDEVRDLALLKIEETGLVAADLSAAPRPVELGQFVLALGRSEDVEDPTLTTGIVSAAERHDGASFQIDARTNYGAAGGAVVDLEGRLVGIVSRVVARSNWGQNSGISFATPISLVRKYLPDYQAGKVFSQPRPPFLGVQADTSALDVVGVRVAQVIQGTAAEEAGLAEGDVILEFNGKKVNEFGDLARSIRDVGIGGKVTIKFVRGGVEKTAEATIGERPLGQ